MVLTREQVKDILLTRPNKDLMKAAREYSKKLVMHMTGIGLGEYIEKLETFERPELLAVRKKYARSNKDLFARIHKPIDKVFNARGGSVYYNLDKAKETKLISALSEVEWGYTLRRWIECFWLNAYHYDPMGVVFIEVDENGEAYPTWKCVHDIYEYELNGRDLEYIVFKLDAKKVKGAKDGREYFRVVDDAFDTIYELHGEKLSQVRGETYPNYFGEVPARINSDMYDQLRGLYISPDDALVEMADNYLIEGSVFNVWKKLFGFPQKWQYQGVCNVCHGSSQIQGEPCYACGGTGKKSKYDVSESITLAVPEGDQPVIAPDVAGYITPPVEAWDKMGDSIMELENLMHFTKWSVNNAIKPNAVAVNAAPTATQILMDNAPMEEALNKYSEAAEKMEKWVIDYMGQFMFGSYGGVDLNYGRKYLTDMPDTLWKKYQDARQQGAPETTLNSLLQDYYYTRHQNDSIELKKYLKLMEVEPFLHYTVEKAKDFVTDNNEYNRKLFYSEWLSTITLMDIIRTDVQTLRDMLTDYVNRKGLKEDNPIAVPQKTNQPQAV